MILEIERHLEGIERGNQSLLSHKPSMEDWQFAKQGDRQVDGVISQAPGSDNDDGAQPVVVVV